MTDAGSNRNNKSFKDATPDEVERKVHEKVAKGVGAVAGAADAVSQKVPQTGEKVQGAMKQTGHATREVSGTAAHEIQKTKSALNADEE